MKHAVALLSVLLLSAAASAAVGASAAPVPPVPAIRLQEESVFDVWIRERLAIGLSASWSKLTDRTRPKDVMGGRTFVGYVWKLEDTDQTGIVPEIRYWAAPFARVSLGLDRVCGRTRNYNLEKHSDGDAELMGPQLLVEGLYPLCDDTVLFHAGAGIVYDFADFSEVAWWHLGYASEASWNRLGRPRTPRAGYTREIRVDDAFGWTLAAGAAWRPHPNFEVDLSLRHTWVDPDCEFGYNHGGRIGFRKDLGGDLALDHLTVALTGSYVF